MAIFQSTGVFGYLCSALRTGKLDEKGRPIYTENFLSGFAGWGWKIWKTVSGFFRLEIDELVVRRTMTVFELLIQKIRAIVGAQAITQGNGKIKGVELSEDGTTYLLTLEEDEISIVEHDFIRCQVFGGGQRFYHVEIASVEGGVIRILASEFAGSSLPLPGDEVVQFGNSSHDPKYAGRHSAIYMHTDESGQPAIDVMFDIYSKSWEGCTKVRVGGDIPGSGGLKGFYCENGMIKGVDSTGHSVYCIYPDGSAMFGDGSAQFNTDRSGHIAGGAIEWHWDEKNKKHVCTMKGVVLTWENLDDEAKENLKGEPGEKGDTGGNGRDGINGADGVNGNDGVSLVYKGEFSSHPANPRNGWYYRNTTDKKSYVYHGAWYVMTVDGSDGLDGINGSDGADGLSIVWKGDSATPPSNPQKNWVYRDTDNGMVYIYNGMAWELMVADGSNGTDGADGTNGLSVFITYNDSESQPSTPTENGTLGGWHTSPNTECVWMSQKVASDASSGSWGTPIRIKGTTGPQGVPGAPGKDGKVLYTWIRYADSSTGVGISNNPTGKLYIGLAYNKETQVESNTPSDYMWSLIKGTDGADGTDGVPGAPGADGKTTYTWIAYSDNADGSYMYQVPNDNTKYIGIAVNKDTKTEGTNPDNYTWSRFKGSDGADGRPGEDANLLPWVEQWNNNKTLIDGEWVASPKMFSGTRNPDTGKLTGIAQGVDCITIDGKKRTGIFALVDGEIVFELDPMTKKYAFTGRVESGTGKGNRIVIDPDSNSLNMYDEKNQRVTRLDFSGSSFSWPKMEMTAFGPEGKVDGRTIIRANSIELMKGSWYPDESSYTDYRSLGIDAAGITFYEKGIAVKYITAHD